MALQRFIKFSVFIFLLQFSSAVYAHNNQQDDIIDRLLKHAGSSIEKVEEDRIVFYPDKTCLYEGSIYVEGENGEAIDLSCVHQNLFYEGSALSFRTQSKERRVLYICVNCSWGAEISSKDPTPIECPRCHYAPLRVRYR